MHEKEKLYSVRQQIIVFHVVVISLKPYLDINPGQSL